MDFSRAVKELRLIVRHQVGTKDFRVVEDFHYRLKNGQKITVPAGTKTDFSSIPSVFRSFIDNDGLAAEGGVIHDHLYKTGGEGGRFTRKESDEILKEVLEGSGLSGAKVNLIYLFVRIFGKKFWKSEKK